MAGFKIADAFVEVTARTSSLTSAVRGSIGDMERAVGPDAERAGSGIGKKFMGGFLKDIRSPSSLKTFIATVGGITAAALAMTPAVIAAGKWIGELTSAAGAASPALLALGAAGGMVFATLKFGFENFGTALRQGDTPAQIKKINKAIAELHPEARATAMALRELHPEFDAFKDRLQGRIFQGLAQDARDAARALMESVSPGMERVATSTNGVIARLLDWTKSTAGITATTALADATAGAMERLSPKIAETVVSFGNMIGRIAGVSTAAGADGLGGVLDRLIEKMNGVTAASVQVGLDGLRDKYIQVRDAISATIDWISQAIDFWTRYRTEIGYVQDALALLAIAFGGPVIAVGAAVLLIVRHWGDLKAAWQAVLDYFNTNSGSSVMENLRVASQNTVDSLLRNWQSIKEVVGPVLQEIIDKILNKVIPAFAEFLRAVEPVATWFRDVLGPVVAEEMRGIFEVISGVLDMITGAFQVFTGVLTGDWSKMWEGIKNICSGAWQIIKEIFYAAGGQIVIDLFNKGQQLWRDFTGWMGRLRDDASNAINNLRDRAIATFLNLVNDALNKGRELKDGFVGWVGRLRDDTVGFINTMRDRVVGTLDSLRDGFNRTVDNIGGIWNRLRDVVRHPVNGVIDIWNRVNDIWNGANVAHFASGGKVPGQGTRDTIPAMLTPGEFVVRKGIAEPTRRFLEALNEGQAEAVQAAGGMFGRVQKFAVGGAVDRGQEWARGQHGKPYIWGGVGPRGYDCSGFMSAIANHLLGRNPHQRIGTTGTAPWGGWANGLTSAFGVGYFKGNPGHMAGTLGGANVEAGGSPSRTKYVDAAAGARHGQFRGHMSLPQVGGEFTGGGGGGGFWAGLSKAAIELALKPFLDFLGPLMTSPDVVQGAPGGIFRALKDAALNKALSFVGFGGSGGGGGGGTGPAVEQVRAVAARFGWGSGAEWDALHALIQKESSWDPGAANRRSSARGLFQKMTSLHGPVESTPGGQAEWGLNYIRGRYGSPSAALAFHNRNNYYDSGGMLLPGTSVVHNATGRPERVLTAAQTAQFDRLVSSRTGGATTNYFNVVLDAKTVGEMQSVIQFFNRVQQTARATTAGAGRVS